MIIAIDVDNTINNLQETVISLFNSRYGTNYSIADFTDYDVVNVLPVHEAVKMQEMYGDAGLYNYVKPIVGANEGIEKLISLGHQVYLVSDTIPKTFGEKVEFIKRFFPSIDEAHIIAMKDKWLLRADIIIEDKLQTVLAKPYWHRILLDYPWNQSTKDYVYDIFRCSNWNEVVEAVNKICDGE